MEPEESRREVPGDRPSWPQRKRRARPVLASEALRDDVAPVEPGRVAARWFCGGYALLLAAFGVESLRHEPDRWLRWAPPLALAILAVLAAALPVRYVERARAMAVLGALTAFVGIGGGGLELRRGGEGDLAHGALRLLAGSWLPATLLFRAHYRAFAGARWLLAAGLLGALPAAGLDVAAIVRAQGVGPRELVAMALPVVVLASSVGFMGAQTTAAGNALAPAVVAALAAEVFVSAAHAWTLRGVFHAALPAVAFAAAAGTLAVGLSQILAHRFSDEARKLDVRQSLAEDEDDEDAEPPTSDWAGRG